MFQGASLIFENDYKIMALGASVTEAKFDAQSLDSKSDTAEKNVEDEKAQG